MEPAIEVGQVWEGKRDPQRRVLISHIYTGGDASVRRNTSRRMQAISPDHLRKTYRLTDRTAL